MKTLKLLVVTRENQFDKRYGLAKSLTPVLDELSLLDVDILYLSQMDITQKNGIALRRFHAGLSLILSLWPVKWKKTNLHTLSWVIIERINMGRLAAKVAKQGFTHVHCHDPLIAAGFQYFSRSRKFKHGVTQHGFGSYSQALHEDGVELGPWIMRHMRNWECRILKNTDWVVSPTELGQNQLARDLCCYPVPQHWRTIPHPRYPLESFSREAARKQLNWETDCIHIISVGRLVALKDFPTLIKACSQIQSDKQWHLTILGDGDWNSIQQLAHEAGLNVSQFSLHSSDDISLWYAAADLYVSTSITESFGMANHEAVCAGLPCILTAVGGVPEAARHAVTYIPPRETHVLTEVLEYFINNDVERVNLSLRAKNYAQRWPTTKSIAKAYLACYQGDFVIKLLPLPQNKKTEATSVNVDHWGHELQQLDLHPMPTPLPIEEKSRVLIFAPHPDDETFSMGGAIFEMQSKQCKISIVLATKPQEEGRIEEFHAVLKEYGVHVIYYLDEKDGQYQNNDNSRLSIRQIIEKSRPKIIFTPSVLDGHRDHMLASLSILQVWSEMHCPSLLFFYEFWQPLPVTHFIDITEHKDRKIGIIKKYNIPEKHLNYQTICHSLQAFRRETTGKEAADKECFMFVDPRGVQDIINSCIRLRRIMR